jgi:hypothetical protein
MSTLRERRATDRERQKRWRDKQRKEGRKQISAMLSLKAQIILNREKRRNNASTSDVIERAVLQLAERSRMERSRVESADLNISRQLK